MLEQFTRQNRWWLDPVAIERDRHLSRVRGATLKWAPPLPFRFDHDAIYTLRGPRQVGKSTVLKHQIAALLAEGWSPRRILYLDVELAGLERVSDLIASLRAYLDGERSPVGEADPRAAIFLDEVTRVANWAGALRGLVDNDELAGVTVIATGSHTRDLGAGGERLPGRRGGGSELDVELLPLSFREYVALVDPTLPLPPPLPFPTPDAARAWRRERAAVRPRLAARFDRYLATGGFLSALNDAADTGGVRAETYQLYREAIVGEFTRAGLRETYLRELVNWLARRQGQEFDYRGIAADTDIGSKDTARNYVDNLIASYVALVSYRTPSLERPAPGFRGSKKIHSQDPLFWHLIRAWAASDPDPWPASVASLESPDAVRHLVESVLAVHLRRAFGERVFYWRPDARQEIDFVIARPDAAAARIEAKYQTRVHEGDLRPLITAGGGIVATRGHEGDLAGGQVYTLPAAELLVLLEAPALAARQL